MPPHPCPFCSYPHPVLTATVRSTWEVRYYYACPACGAQGPDSRNDEQLALLAWNTRLVLDEQAEIVDSQIVLPALPGAPAIPILVAP